MMEKVHSGEIILVLTKFADTNSLNNSTSDFSSHNDDDIDNSIHSHTAPPFLMNDSKLFSTPGSFNFSMAALAADSAALAGNFISFKIPMRFESNAKIQIYSICDIFRS